MDVERGDKDDVCASSRRLDACRRTPVPGTTPPWSGAVGHAFHLQSITKWLNSQAEQRCPICRGAWEFKQLNAAGEEARGTARGEARRDAGGRTREALDDDAATDD